MRSYVYQVSLVGLFLVNSTVAMAGLTLSPTYISLDPRHRTANVLVANQDNEKSTIVMRTINYKQIETGEYKMVKKPVPGDCFADEMIRFGPRQVTLAPGESQMVRIQLINLGTLTQEKPKECRTHLMASALPKATHDKEAAEKARNSRELKVEIEAVYGMSIPVIVRTGEMSEPVISLSNVKATSTGPAKKKTPALAVTINREGATSVRGELVALLEGQEIGRINNVNVFLSTTKRHLTMPLMRDIKEGKPILLSAIAGKKITLEYRVDPQVETKDPERVWARTEITYP